MARSRDGQHTEDTKSGLEELAALVPDVKPPDTFGKFHGDPLDDRFDGTSMQTDAEATSEDENEQEEGLQASAEDAAQEEAAGEDEADGTDDSDGPSESEDDAAAQLRQRLDDQDKRIEAQQRELDAYRRPPNLAPTAEQAPIDPFADFNLPFNVSEADLAAINEGGEKGAALLSGALRLAAQAGARHGAKVMANAYVQDKHETLTAENFTKAFWNANQDLTPFADVVQTHTETVWREFPNAPLHMRMSEISRRARVRLKEMGVTVGKPKRTRRPKGEDEGETRRIRPAGAEMSGGRGGNGTARLTKDEKQMFELIPNDHNYG